MKKIAKIMICLTALFAFSCEVNRDTTIPEMPVSLTIDIMRDAPELNVIGGFKEFVKPATIYQYLGFGGILVFRSFDDSFVAFDLACPHEIKRDVRVECDMSGIATCPKCGSTYDVGYGSGTPRSGAAAYPLRKYTVQPYGNSSLRVFAQ